MAATGFMQTWMVSKPTAAAIPARKLDCKLAGGDTPPATPTDLSRNQRFTCRHRTGLGCTPNIDGDLAGLEVAAIALFRATITDHPPTSYTDSSVTQSETYTYYIVALDSTFNRSGQSNEFRRLLNYAR